VAYFPIIGGFCPECCAFGSGVLIREFQRCEGTAFGKAIETDITILETGSRPDRQVAVFPIVARRDEDVKIGSVGTSAGGTAEGGAICVVTTWASAHGSIQVKTVAKESGVEANFSPIDIDVTAAIQVDVGVGVAPRQANGEVWTDSIVYPKGKAACVYAVAACIRCTIDVGEFAKARKKHAQAVIRSRREHWRTAFAFRSGHSGKTLAGARRAPIDREARRTEAAAASAYIGHALSEV
jgi:hypothetical protein